MRFTSKHGFVPFFYPDVTGGASKFVSDLLHFKKWIRQRIQALYSASVQILRTFRTSVLKVECSFKIHALHKLYAIHKDVDQKHKPNRRLLQKSTFEKIARSFEMT